MSAVDEPTPVPPLLELVMLERLTLTAVTEDPFDPSAALVMVGPL